MTKLMKRMQYQTALATGALVLMAGNAMADQVFADDIIGQASLCVGQDCVNGESFGFDTIRMKENNLRIRAQDTSVSASFPSVDWLLTFNDTANGGANRFSVEAIDNGTRPFTIEYGAKTNALVVGDNSNIGFGTASPVVGLHTVNGNSPTLRLEQDGSSGFTPQTWDLAGNEANFFVRDATNGSTLPFRIEPGVTSSLVYLDSTDRVGINTAAPETRLHVRSTDQTAKFLVEEASATAATRGLLELRNNGSVFMTFTDTSAGATDWNVQNNSGNFRITNSVGAGREFDLDTNGNLEITGGLTTGTAGTCTSVTPCDAVFDPAVYTVPSIAEHAESMWADKYLPAVGPTLPGQRVDLTKKVLNMLNELEHAHIYIEQLHTQITDMEQRMDAVEADKG
ncbi:hypothetical protein [Pseudosulfitobacter sp. SM2401]|uniref:hypothetical protein n=1 Tax=Pseudosulfitobacter sp. SM2401 TaxID=3350098 RepID=UPI0036F30F04